MSGSVRIRLASALAVERGGVLLSGRDLGSRKARTMLALLAAERRQLVPVDRIVDVLWPQEPPADPGANVSTLVSRSRRLLGERVIVGTGRAYGLIDRDSWTVDLDDATALAGEAEVRLGAREPALAVAAARHCLEVLGTQPALVDEADDDWVLGVRREADVLRRRARHALAAALTDLDPATAAEAARAAVDADPFDERAVRDLMRADVAAGRTAAALASHDDLARRLRRELGTDPDATTSALHLAILRETTGPEEPTPSTRSGRRRGLVGRDAELAALETGWSRAGSGHGALLVVEGEGGIGKTRLLEVAAELAASTGGRVLGCRCHPTERSLFLEPYVEAVRPVLLEQSETGLAALVRGHEPAWLQLVPELEPVLPAGPTLQGPPELQRRRAYEAVTAVLRRLSRDRPVLLTVDDLQDGGAATVDLLGHMAARLARARVLLVGAVRSEDAEALSRLSDRGTVLHLDTLTRSAVESLAEAAGLAAHGAEVMERTAGHPLSVVESLRALSGGDTGLPLSLAEAFLARVNQLDPPAREVIRAASVLGRRLDPPLLAALTETTELVAVRHCEALSRARLLVPAERHYEFANDLLQECVYRSLPPALAAAHHRRAADLMAAHPESMAEHAFSAGDHDRAAQGWLLAGEAAMRRSALDDAALLYSRALNATGDRGLRARLLLARSATREARSTFAEGLADIEEALALARALGDRRLEMAALRARGGDVAIGLHLPTDSVVVDLEAAIAIASDLGDRPAEADVSARLTVLDVGRLRFTSALQRAETTLRRARHRPDLRVLALDGLKTALAYLGAVDRLQVVTDELEAVLSTRETSWLLQWVVFESAFVPAADGRWDDCRARVEEAFEHNRRTGYTAYAGFFDAQLGWFERLAGDLDAAVRQGRRAVERTSPTEHPWWYAAACGMLAASLVETGELEEAEVVARRGLANTGPGTAEAWRLRCAAPLAAVSDDDVDWSRAATLLRGIEAPSGHAWVTGADCYLLVGRAALRRDALAEVAEPLQALHDATTEHWAPVHRAVGELVAAAGQKRSASRLAARAAPPSATGR